MSNLSGAFENGGYQTGSVEPSTFDDLPAGDYQVIIVDSEMKDTKDFSGKYLQLTYDIMEGEHKGRKIFDRLNLVNRNDVAKRIAMQTLESICRATNFNGLLKDSAQLHRKLMVIRMGYAEFDKKGNPIAEGNRNSIKAYKPIAATHAAPMPTAAQQAKPYNAGDYSAKSGEVSMAPPVPPTAQHAPINPPW